MEWVLISEEVSLRNCRAVTFWSGITTVLIIYVIDA